MARNREKTEQKIRDALVHVLAESGFGDVGVNAVAREAGVDKVLIYRYFDGLEGLFADVAQTESFWPSIEQMTELTSDEIEQLAPFELANRILVNFSRTLRKRPLTQEILRWELLEKNELTDAFADTREEQGTKMIEMFGEHPQLDLPAIGAIIFSGLTYLILRSKTADTYLGIDISSDEGWGRLEKAIFFLVVTMFKHES